MDLKPANLVKHDGKFVGIDLAHTVPLKGIVSNDASVYTMLNDKI